MYTHPIDLNSYLQVSTSDRVCHACWLKTKRDALRSQELDANRVPEQNPAVDLPSQPSNLQLTDSDIQPGHPDLNDQHSILDNQIILPNYKRAPNTASHCVFTGCDNLNLHTLSDSLRSTILSNYKYYIPKLARVCRSHLYGNTWDTLYDSESSLNSFTAEQIEHVFSFANAFKPILDFSSIESVQEMDHHLFSYWMGMTKENFLTLLEELPRVMESHRGILGLAAILIKMRTGDSDERLGTILEIPRTTLERLMTTVRVLMLQD